MHPVAAMDTLLPAHFARCTQTHTHSHAPPCCCTDRRYVGALKSLHLRHDSPGLFPGWQLDQAQLFVTDGPSSCSSSDAVVGVGSSSAAAAPTGGAPYLPGTAAAARSGSGTTPVAGGGPSAPSAVAGGAAAGGGGPTPAAAADPGGRPRVYSFAVGAGPPEAWPCPETPYIRHYATLEAAKFGEAPSRYGGGE